MTRNLGLPGENFEVQLSFHEPILLMEKALADISHSLKIKYGLRAAPRDEKVQEWYRETDRLIRSGMAKDVAGQRAAAQVFPDYNTHVYASEADTIEYMLRRLIEK